jgi:general secretion pathway protein A
LYLQFFGLDEAPFAITPDPAFVYLSAAHRDALAHLLYGVGQGGAGGFVQLTGEVGTGKTTLCRCLIEQIPDGTRVALVLNPLMTPQELLATICEELGLDTAGISDSNKAMVDALNRYLLQQHAAGHRVVVVIDEAQNLSPEALEQVRLLTNLETAKNKLLQMVLLGQPELRDLLQRRELRQLAQRITARYHLGSLGRNETFAYVKHRMTVAGARSNPFRKSALSALYQRSGGVPRLINIIADRALAGAYAREQEHVTAALVNAAANEVQPSEKQVHGSRRALAAAALSVAALVIVSIVAWGPALLERAEVGQPGLAASPPPLPAQATEVEAGAVPPNEPEAAAAELPPPSEMAAPAAQASEPAGPPDHLDGSWLATHRRSAWQGLAELWRDGAGASAIRSACDGASGSGYGCIQETGSWSRIRRLGLPVLLVLRGEDPGLLLFRGFSARGLWVGRDGEMIEVSRDAVERGWLGEYFVAWPQSPDWPGEIQRGQSGKAVDIVMEMATYANPAWQGGTVFDRGFEDWLVSFQQRNGLEADGIIGPNTLIYLMAPMITEPRLIRPDEENS